jgi:hypothetical protein
MNEAFDRTRLHATTLELAWGWFHRLLAAYSLLFGVLYWVRLIGFYDGAQWRFDLMPPHWQVASVALAVLFPFAASGLWMLASWGPVIWFICAAIEFGMYLGFPDLFGFHLETVIAHGVIAVVYTAFRILFYMRARKEAD